MTKRFALAFAALSTAVAGCGSSSLPSLTTGSLFSSQKPAQTAAPVPPPDDPIARAVHVGATAARAQKCGYFFDPQQMRSSFLAAEAQRSAAPEALKKLESSYDFARLRVGRQIAAQDGYCTGDRTADIKKDLNRYLAGDFSAPKKKVKVAESGGLFGNIDVDDRPDKFNKEAIHDRILGGADNKTPY